MSERFTNPTEFFDTEPEQIPEKPQNNVEVSTLSEPIKFDPEKKEIIILASEGKEEQRHPFQAHFHHKSLPFLFNPSTLRHCLL